MQHPSSPAPPSLTPSSGLPSLSRPPLSHEGSAHPAPFFALEFDPQTREIVLLDQLLLPHEVRYLRLKSADKAAEAIREMHVRGAPAIGICAAYALVLVADAITGDAPLFLVASGAAGRALGATRPTAVNLHWAIARMSKRAAEVAALPHEARAQAMLEEAEAIHREDVAACRAMGALGAADIRDGATILTHCNTGALATGGFGTALGVIRAVREAGKSIRVLATETRPYLQGARLTAWELMVDGFDVELITDSMVGHFMKEGAIDFVIVGADRVARNGDSANKIGTYGIAVLARHHGLSFNIAAPWSTVDLRCPSGAEIPIEERSSDEVASLGGQRIAAPGVRCRHPAFDVTPYALIDHIYTERGLFQPDTQP